jgi:hypothetical protein
VSEKDREYENGGERVCVCVRERCSLCVYVLCMTERGRERRRKGDREEEKKKD